MNKIATTLATLALTGCASTYGSLSLETSNSPNDDQIQSRFEIGNNPAWLGDMVDFYIYHESDPRNGLEGAGWPRETENGAGIRVRIGD